MSLHLMDRTDVFSVLYAVRVFLSWIMIVLRISPISLLNYDCSKDKSYKSMTWTYLRVMYAYDFRSQKLFNTKSS